MSTSPKPVSSGAAIDVVIDCNIKAIQAGWMEPLDLAVEKLFFFRLVSELVDYQPLGPTLKVYVYSPKSLLGQFASGVDYPAFNSENHAGKVIELDRETIAKGVKVGTPQGFSTVKLKPDDLADLYLKFVQVTGWIPHD